MPSRKHLLYIDNLRTTLIIMVILLHLAITYGAQGSWYYKEPGEISTVTFVVVIFVAAVGSAFILGEFFLLAGYFTAFSYEQKGLRLFLVDRIRRLLIPLALYEIFAFPLIRYFVRIREGYQGSIWSHLAEHFLGLRTIADGPVWFLLSLMIFSLAYISINIVIKTFFNGLLNIQPTGNLPGNFAIAILAFVLGLVTFLTRTWFPVGKFYEPLHQEFAHYPQYITMFVIGIFAYRYGWLDDFTGQLTRFWNWVALTCMLFLPFIAVAAGALTGELDERGAGGMNWISFCYSMWEGYTCMAMSFVSLAWFRKRFDHQGRIAKKMADASFASYIIHPLIIVPLALILRGISIPLDLKFIIVSPLAVALTFFIAYSLCKLPLARNIL